MATRPSKSERKSPPKPKASTHIEEREITAENILALRGLSERERRFVAEYQIDRNATQAAVRAGYSEKTAYSQGSRLLKRVEIQEALRSGLERIAAKASTHIEEREITAENILAEAATIAFANIADVVTWGGALRPLYEKDNDGNPVLIGYTAGVGVIDSDKLPRSITAAIAEISEGPNGIKIKMHPKLPALEKLGQHLGMFQKNAPGTAENPFVAFIQSMQGTPLPIGHQQELPRPQEPAEPAPAPGVTQLARPQDAVQSVAISPLLRPGGA